MTHEQINEGDIWAAGIAYVICPSDIDRSVYINQCYSLSRISIQLEDGSVYHRTPIDLDTLNFIDFPQEGELLGTAVVYVAEPKHRQPIVVARLQKSDQLGSGRENSFHIKRLFKDRLVSIVGDVDVGSLNIDVNAGDKVGKVSISLDNNENNSIFEIEVAGTINLKTTNDTYIENAKQFKSVITSGDQDESKNPSVISQTRKKTLVGNEEVVINGKDISAIHYKGYRIAIDSEGIKIDSLDKNVIIQSGDSKVEMTPKGIFLEGKKISIEGSFEALYNLTPGAPITDVSQIGISKKVTIG